MPVGVLEEISKSFKKVSKFAGKNPWWSPFIVKLRPVIAFKKNKVKITRSNLSKRDAYTETLTQVFSVNFEKNYKHGCSARLRQIKSLLFIIQLCFLHQQVFFVTPK